MEICKALPDAFQGSKNSKEESTEKQVQLFLEEVMQEVETVMDDLSAVIQNVTVTLSSTVTEFDATFCPSSSYYLQVQVQKFLDDIMKEVSRQISSSTCKTLVFPDLNEVKDEEQVEVDNSNSTNTFDKPDDNEVKIVMDNILGNLKELLCQEDDNCSSTKTCSGVAEADSHTQKRKVLDHENVQVAKKVRLSQVPKDDQNGDKICVEEANTVKQTDFENRVSDVLLSEDSKIASTNEESPIDVSCIHVNDTLKLNKETEDKILVLTEEQKECDQNDSVPEQRNSKIMLPESQNICTEGIASASHVTIPSVQNQITKSVEKHEADDEASKPQLPQTDTEIESTPVIVMKDHLQSEGSQKKHVQETLCSSPERKEKVSDPHKNHHSPNISSAPKIKDYLQIEGSQKRVMQDTLCANPEKRANSSDLQKSDQNSPNTQSTPNSMRDHLLTEGSHITQGTLTLNPDMPEKKAEESDALKDQNSPCISTPNPVKDHLQTEGSKKRIMQDILTASPEKKAKVCELQKHQDISNTSNTPDVMKDHPQSEGSQERALQDTSFVSSEKKTTVSDTLKDQKSPSSSNASCLLKSLHFNASVSYEKEQNDRDCSEEHEMTTIPNNSEHEEEEIDITKKNNEDQTVPSLIAAEEAKQQTENDIIMEDASLYFSDGSNEKAEEKPVYAASDNITQKVIKETPDDSRQQNYEEDPVDTGSQMVPSIHDSDVVTDILQTLQYHSQQPSTGVPPLLMPVFNVGPQKATGPLERLPPIPACTRRKRVGLSRRQAIPRLHSVSRESKPLVPKETEQ